MIIGFTQLIHNQKLCDLDFLGKRQQITPFFLETMIKVNHFIYDMWGKQGVS
jgi:hypothetical protein